MGLPSYMQSGVDQNVITLHMTVYIYIVWQLLFVTSWCYNSVHVRVGSRAVCYINIYYRQNKTIKLSNDYH
jgi:hypothetical protein